MCRVRDVVRSFESTQSTQVQPFNAAIAIMDSSTAKKSYEWPCTQTARTVRKKFAQAPSISARTSPADSATVPSDWKTKTAAAASWLILRPALTSNSTSSLTRCGGPLTCTCPPMGLPTAKTVSIVTGPTPDMVASTARASDFHRRIKEQRDAAPVMTADKGETIAVCG